MRCFGERKRGVYSCASTDDTERISCGTNEWKLTHRSAMVQLLGGVYGLTIVTLGLVFSVAAALTLGRRSNYGQDSYYLEALQIFLFTMSLFFLVYLHAYLLRSFTSKTPLVTGQLDLPTEEKSTEKINLEELDSGGENKSGEEHRSKSTTPIPNTHSLARSTVTFRPRATFDGKSVNFYLRLGIFVFGTGSMVHDGFRLSQLLQDGHLSFDCLSPLDIAVIALHICFTFFQTFFLFKSHNIVVYQRKGLARFGFIHLIATNVCVAIVTIVDEIRNDVMINADQSQSNQPGNQTGGGCLLEKNLSWSASPYLYPCAIQYCLISAAIVCQMHRNIPTAHARLPAAEPRAIPRDQSSVLDVIDDAIATHGVTGSTTTAPSPAQVDCDKAHKGLFLGLVVVVLTLVAISCYFVFGTGSGYFRSPDEANYYSGFIFFFTELSLLVLATAAVLAGFAKFRNLRFIPISGDQLETALLIFALSGVIAMKSFHTVSAVSAIQSGEDNVPGILAVCTAAGLLLQVLLQTVFLVDTLRRSVQSPIQKQRKPGRALVTFLLLCNVALLVVSVFEAKKTEYFRIHDRFYGHLAWSAISHSTVPVHIFYRFHSVVCLSEIWSNAYRIKEK